MVSWLQWFVWVDIVQLFLLVVRPEGWLVDWVQSFFRVGILEVLHGHLIVWKEGFDIANFTLIPEREDLVVLICY